MQTEIEVKFCDIDVAAMRSRLEKAGATCEQPMRLMRRALIEEPHHTADDSFLRIRDEGDKVTLTFKRRVNPESTTIDSVKEIEVEVSNFDDTVELLREAGWTYKTFQESKRETWHLDNVEVVIDEWPWLNPYVEIEGPSEEAVQRVAEQLGFSWDEALFGHVDYAYLRQYDFVEGFRGVIDLKEAKFDMPLPAQFLPKSTS